MTRKICTLSRKAREQRYRAKDPDHYRELSTARCRRWRHENPEKCKARKKRYRIRLRERMRNDPVLREKIRERKRLEKARWRKRNYKKHLEIERRRRQKIVERMKVDPVFAEQVRAARRAQAKTRDIYKCKKPTAAR